MKLLKEIKDDKDPIEQSRLEFREAARGVFFDEQGQIPVLFVANDNYHKLPGGGIDSGEDRLTALKRELQEETGCEIEVTGELGEVLEYRSKWNLKQTSYCYYGKIISKGEQHFMEDEIAAGFQVVWMSLDDAIATLEKDNSERYDCFFMKQRDLAILQAVKDIR